MQRLTKILAIMMMTGCTSFATAGVGNVTDTTTCYLFKNNKLIQRSSCKYDAEVGSSMSYSVNEYTYRVPKFGKIRVVDNYSDGETDENYFVHFKSETHTLNGKKAINRVRHPKTFAIISDKQLQAHPELKEDMLECSAYKDNSLEICTPPNNLG